MSLPDSTTTATPPPATPPATPPTTPPTASAPALPGLSQVMIDLLRKIVKDADFQLQFIADPVLAVTTAGIQITTAELDRVKQIIPYLGQLTSGLSGLTGAPVGLRGKATVIETTHTLAYAVALAVAFAAILA
jgi:hypothetical protein